jgi:hypothetical protein
MQFHRLSRLVPAVLTSVASAQIVVPAGFNVTVYPIGMQLTGLGLLILHTQIVVEKIILLWNRRNG